MPLNRFRSQRNSTGASAVRTVEVEPDNGTDIEATRGIYVGTPGDLEVIMAEGTPALYKNLAAGLVHPISVTRIRTGTTAEDILALY